MTRRRSLLTVVMAVAVALAGCGGDDEPEERAQPTTTVPPATEATTTEPTTTEPSDEAQLRQLAEDWSLFVRRTYAGLADHESASDYLADPYLSGYQARFADFLDSGESGRLSEASRHEVLSVEVSGHEATLIECSIDADVLIGVEGEVLNDTVQANLYETRAIKGEEGWRLTDRTDLAEIDDSQECPEP